MPQPNWLLNLVFSFFAVVSIGHAAPNFSSQNIKQLYKDGEFEKVRTQLEAFLKRADASTSREDRILAYKYLGVVYASRPDGAPQAEAYFFRLFDLAPKVQITELYASSSVNDLFKKTQERFLFEKQTSSSIDEFGNPIPSGKTDLDPPAANEDRMGLAAQGGAQRDTAAKSKEPIPNTPRKSAEIEKKGPVIWPWVLGAVVVGGGVGLYVMGSEDPQVKKDQIAAGKN